MLLFSLFTVGLVLDIRYHLMGVAIKSAHREQLIMEICAFQLIVEMVFKLIKKVSVFQFVV
jgi:hypothetical protein